MTEEKQQAEIGDEVETEEEEDDRELQRDDYLRFREKLLGERRRVKERLERHLAEASEDTDNLPDEMDIASRQTDKAYLFRLADKERKLLAEIDHALAKFERGTYGICEGTGDAIGYKRLELRPWTRYSLEYKEKLEREQGRSR
jgi:DnaK suppressor protein